MEELTFFAPAERDDFAAVKHDFESIKNDSRFKLLNLINVPTLVLNEHRQIILFNDIIAKIVNKDSPNDILGKRPGELLGCKSSTEMQAGCGTSKACATCGAVIAIWESQKTKEKKVDECLLSCDINGKEESFEFEVTVNPAKVDDRFFYIMTLLDVSDEKRKQMIEKIFFHDLLNLTGGLTGVLDLFASGEKIQVKELVHVVESISKDMVEQIQAQRDLLGAESEELVLDIQRVKSNELIDELTTELSNHPVAKEKYLINDTDPDMLTVETDPRLLKRVLTNMIKNALEAEPVGSHIFFSCQRVGMDEISFYVMNPSFIPEEVQYNLFKRSYSTKGQGRGLGTYSMKLLAEQYLKGEMSFNSTETQGTTFYCKLPLKYKKG